MKFRPLSMRLRLAAGLVVGKLLTLALVLLVVQLDLTAVFRADAAARLRQVIEVMLAQSGQAGPHLRLTADGGLPLDAAGLARTHAITGATIHVLRGSDLLVSSDAAAANPAMLGHDDDPRLARGGYFAVRTLGPDIWYSHTDVLQDAAGAPAGRVVVLGPKANFDAWVDAIRTRLLLLGGATTLLVGGLFAWALGRLFRRFERVQAALQALAARRLDTVVPYVDAGDEVGALARAAAAYKASSLRLQESEVELEGLARFFHENPSPVLRVAGDGRVIDANRAAACLLGLWQTDIGGQVPATLRTLLAETLAGAVTRAADFTVGAATFAVLISPVPRAGYVNLFGREVTEERRQTAQAQYLAAHDSLTGLPNRRSFTDALDAAIGAGAGALLFIDLDQFKEVNDSLGHPVGDQLLIAVSGRLGADLPPDAILARLGGDEFAVLLPGLADAGAAMARAEALIAALLRPFDLPPHRLQIGASVGVALFPRDGAAVADLIVAADLAMYAAKAAGRGRARPFDATLRQAVTDRVGLIDRLRQALAEDRLAVHYQPKVTLEDGVLVGAEALVRWHDPELGWIPPDRFIPVAEQAGLIGGLGRFVLRRACADAASWPMQGAHAPHVAVNLSALQLREADLVDGVAAILAETGLDPHRLELEVTESAAMEDAGFAATRLAALRALGVRIAIDDFGTGYSSLSQLRRLSASTLKIDRSFVADLAISADAQAVAQAVVSLGRSLDMIVVAEGVEDAAQQAVLTRLGADLGQGWLFGRPVTDSLFRQSLAAPPRMGSGVA